MEYENLLDIKQSKTYHMKKTQKNKQTAHAMIGNETREMRYGLPT